MRVASQCPPHVTPGADDCPPERTVPTGRPQGKRITLTPSLPHCRRPRVWRAGPDVEAWGETSYAEGPSLSQPEETIPAATESSDGHAYSVVAMNNNDSSVLMTVAEVAAVANEPPGHLPDGEPSADWRSRPPWSPRLFSRARLLDWLDTKHVPPAKEYGR